MQIQLNQNELSLLNNTMQGQGGFQSLQKKLQQQVDNNVITLDDDDIEKLCRYINSYGSGGIQKQLLNIFKNYLQCL